MKMYLLVLLLASSAGFQCKAEKLDNWKNDVSSGKPPDFGANLNY
jgi:hypothetical protein